MNIYMVWKMRPIEMLITERIYDAPDCYDWREVFAWIPVKTIKGKRVWMEFVYKRKFWAVWGDGFHQEPEVEYATLFDILGGRFDT